MKYGNHDMRHSLRPARWSVVLLFCAAAAVTPLFAQDASPLPTLSMWNRGLFNLYCSDGTTSVGPNWMGYPIPQGPYNLLTLNWAAKQVSWTMTAEWDGSGQTYPIYLRDYGGSFTMFGGFARLSAGKLFDGDDYRFQNFDTTGFSTRLANSETGVFLRLYPAKSLSFGVFLPVPVAAQSAAITLSEPNVGIQWTVGNVAVIKASCRLTPVSTTQNREASIGALLTAVRNFRIALGYTYRDVTQEHDLFLDASYNAGATQLLGYADLNLIGGTDLYYGGKLDIEHTPEKSPFTFGTYLAYGNGDVWGFTCLELNPFVRYNFTGSSVQVGMDFLYGAAWAYKVQLQYTVGF